MIVLFLTAVSCGEKTPPPAKVNLNSSVTESVGSVTETSAKVNVTLYDGAEGYYYAIGSKEDKEAFIDGTLAGIKTQSDPSVKEITFDNLTAGTEYYIYVQAFAGDSKGQYSVAKITTQEPAKTEWDLAVAYKIGGRAEDTIMIQFTKVGADAETIEYGIGKDSDLDAFKNGTLATIKKTSNTKITNVTFYNLKRGQEYTVFVRATGDGHVGEVEMLKAKTLQLDFAMAIKEGSITTNSVAVTFTPGGDVENYKYYLGVKGDLDLFNQSIIPTIQVENDVTGPKTFTFRGLESGKDYAVFGRAFSGSGPRTETIMLEFKTL